MRFGGIFASTGLATSLRCQDRAGDRGITGLEVANIDGMGVCESVNGIWLKAAGP